MHARVPPKNVILTDHGFSATRPNNRTLRHSHIGKHPGAGYVPDSVRKRLQPAFRLPHCSIFTPDVFVPVVPVHAYLKSGPFTHWDLGDQVTEFVLDRFRQGKNSIVHGSANKL